MTRLRLPGLRLVTLCVVTVAVAVGSLALGGAGRIAAIAVTDLALAPACLDLGLARPSRCSTAERLVAFVVVGITLLTVSGLALSVPGLGIRRTAASVVPAALAVVLALVLAATTRSEVPGPETGPRLSAGRVGVVGLVVGAVAVAAAVAAGAVAVLSEGRAFDDASTMTLSVSGAKLCAGAQTSAELANPGRRARTVRVLVLSGAQTLSQMPTTTIAAHSTMSVKLGAPCAQNFSLVLQVRTTAGYRQAAQLTWWP